MATSFLPSPPSTIEVLLWLNNECDPAEAEIFTEGAEAYCLYLLNQFSDTTRPSTEDFHRVTDAWLETIVERNSRSPVRAEFVFGMATLCFSGNWIVTHLGPTLWSPALPRGLPGRALLFAYLVRRYELKAHELSLQGLTDGIGSVRLDG
ncbi:hypothetical protein F4824DRAFT_495221 [Ustulina deusta]|nr:hypothetical protein F4824DRAFT_495221 [Ustulina deusta]